VRFRVDRERHKLIIYLKNNRWEDLAYVVFGIQGLQAELEIPSDWHEHRRAWLSLSIGFFKLCLSAPWPNSWPVVADEMQCSGPRYGFQFYEDILWIRWGKDTGRSRDPKKYASFYMPWSWRHRWNRQLSGPLGAPYTYVLRSGEVQHRRATLTSEERCWTRPWIPFRRVERSIWVDFDGEVGERTGSWKGGVTGCGWDMLAGETPLQALRRMERERRFT